MKDTDPNYILISKININEGIIQNKVNISPYYSEFLFGVHKLNAIFGSVWPCDYFLLTLTLLFIELKGNYKMSQKKSKRYEYTVCEKYSEMGIIYSTNSIIFFW